MKLSTPPGRRTLVAIAAPFALAAPALAQNTQTPGTIPGLETFNLPSTPVRPTPLATPEPKIAPLPTPSPAPLASPTPVAPPPLRRTVRPTPVAVQTPVARATSAPPPTPTPLPTPFTPAPASPPPPASTPVQAPAETPTPAAPDTTSTTLAILGTGVALAVLVTGLWLLSRRRRVRDRDADQAEVAALPVVAQPTPVPEAPEPVFVDPVSVPRPLVAIDLEVKRAGTNLLSAAVEYRIVLRNHGEADARGLALDLRLYGVEPGLEGALEALFAAPIERPVVARFDLAAGTTAALEGTAMLPRSAMPPLALRGAGEGRQLFVPVMTVNTAYGWASDPQGGSGQSAATFVVGVDRGEGAKLGPFRLDGPPRMYDRVSRLPFTVSRQR